MLPITDSLSSDILERAYEQLGFSEGDLISTSSTPEEHNRKYWTDWGDWLSLGHQLDIEKIFFLHKEPAIVFAHLPAGHDEGAFFNKIWCMTRPRYLFLERNGELVAYHLSKPPVRPNEPLDSGGRLLAFAQTSSQILETMADFRRESLESGKIYEHDKFSLDSYRADRTLVRDLKTVRRALIDDGLDADITHALIGRSLFIRYLEDRGILAHSYFENIALSNKSWNGLLSQIDDSPSLNDRHREVLFFRVLKSKEFTYTLFQQLEKDFNGDSFPVSSREKRQVTKGHLTLLRRLFIGDSVHAQQQLFLFAYRFDIIPIELISSIYEEFYTTRKGKQNSQSTYYTPPALADFVLSQALTDDVLKKRPRVLDPACGSGIFLVESFRRIVRYRVNIQKKRLSQNELKCILRDQILGIDLNPEAVPVAAFSLYLAYLHYQQPREINAERKLPNLRYDPDRESIDPKQHFDILYAGNAFDAVEQEIPRLKKQFGPRCADVVVGNPPWGEVKKEDQLGKKALPSTLAWCNPKMERGIGDREMSQAFVHLALELLHPGGKAALLLSSGVLFKQHKNSQSFRHTWLSQSKLKTVINFAHVRHIYFADVKQSRESRGIAPFIFAEFKKEYPSHDHTFTYWSAKRTLEVEKSRAIVISSADRHWLNQINCLKYEKTWKIYWWGNHRDEMLVRALERFPSLTGDFGTGIGRGSV